jgi:hypothetical protein
MGVVTTDEYQAPVMAFWHRGLGRIASLTAEVHGEYSPRLNAWGGFQRFAVGLGRWLLGGDPPTGVQATIDRKGGQGIVRVELDPDRRRGGPDDVRTAAATIVPPGDGASVEPQRLTLAWVGEDTLEAQFPLQKAGMFLGAVQLGNGVVLPLAPLSLPYSPEFEPREDPEEGQKVLRDVARISGGIGRTSWDDVFDATRLRDRDVRDLLIPLAVLLLVLHVVEIGGRRLQWFAAANAWVRTRRLPRLPRFRRAPAPRPVDVGAAPAVAPPLSTPADDKPRVAPSAPAVSPLARAKAKARDRMGG